MRERGVWRRGRATPTAPSVAFPPSVPQNPPNGLSVLTGIFGLMARDIAGARTLLVLAGFKEWSDRELFHRCGKRVIFTRERIEHEDDIWVAETIKEGNPGPDWRVHSDHAFPWDILRLVEERCTRRA